MALFSSFMKEENTPEEKSVETSSVNKKVDESYTVIDYNNTFSGEIEVSDLFRIDGSFRGTIRSKGEVVIGKKGLIIGDIYAKKIKVSGKIKGNLYATEKIEMFSSAHLYGELKAPRFFFEEGVIFNGTSTILKEEQIKEIQKDYIDKTTLSISEKDIEGK